MKHKGKTAYYGLMAIILIIVLALAISFSNNQVLANEDHFEQELKEVISQSFTKTDSLLSLRKLNRSISEPLNVRIPLKFQSMDKILVGEQKVEELFSSESNNIAEQDIATLGIDFKSFKLSEADQELAERKLKIASRLYAKHYPSTASLMTENRRMQLKIAKELVYEYFSHRTDDYYDPYALYFLSSIEFSLWDEGKGMHGVVHAIYLINEFPNDQVSELAWVELRDYIQFSYSGTDGVNVPKDWQNLLSSLSVKVFRE
jgi:hypothetical protein